RNITKEYRGRFGRNRFRALDDFSLSIEPGEIFGFLGPNGAGKTTAIHLALGLSFPTSGDGRLLGQRFGHARTRRRVGFLAENVSFYDLSVSTVVRLYAQLNGITGHRLNHNIGNTLEVLDLKEVSDKKISKLSRGMLQKIGLAQALVNDPELLILDEPT